MNKIKKFIKLFKEHAYTALALRDWTDYILYGIALVLLIVLIVIPSTHVFGRNSFFLFLGFVFYDLAQATSNVLQSTKKEFK